MDAEGSFTTLLSKSEDTGKVVTRNRLSISQSIHDIAVLEAIKDFFGSGYLSPKIEGLGIDKIKELDRCFYYNSIIETIMPFFEKYPLYTRKQLDFQDFNKFLELRRNKAHLTEEGYKEMYNLSSNMNSGRDGN